MPNLLILKILWMRMSKWKINLKFKKMYENIYLIVKPPQDDYYEEEYEKEQIAV